MKDRKEVMSGWCDFWQARVQGIIALHGMAAVVTKGLLH
jgi:hypothetical protein